MTSSLKTVNVTCFSQAYRDVKNLYLTAFPKHERPPYLLLILNSYRSFIQCIAYYDEEIFVGFSYVLSDRNQDLVFFLAVNDQFRSKGYGYRILDTIAQNAGEKTVVLTIEPVEEDAKNGEQRKKRLAFYEKNGYRQTPYFYYEGKERYQVLTTAEQADILSLKKIVQQATWGFLKIKIEEEITENENKY